LAEATARRRYAAAHDRGPAPAVRHRPARRGQDDRRQRDRRARLLLETDTAYRLNSIVEFEGRDDYLRVDNTLVSPDEVAERAIRHFRLAARS
jgi:hypothetical protein